MPTQMQFSDWVKTTIAGIAGWAIGHGYGDANLWALIGGVAMLLVPYAWGWVSGTKLAQVQKVAAMPEVASVVIKPSTGNGIAAAAADPSQPKITK